MSSSYQSVLNNWRQEDPDDRLVGDLYKLAECRTSNGEHRLGDSPDFVDLVRKFRAMSLAMSMRETHREEVYTFLAEKLRDQEYAWIRKGICDLPDSLFREITGFLQSDEDLFNAKLHTRSSQALCAMIHVSGADLLEDDTMALTDDKSWAEVRQLTADQLGKDASQVHLHYNNSTRNRVDDFSYACDGDSITVNIVQHDWQDLTESWPKKVRAFVLSLPSNLVESPQFPAIVEKIDALVRPETHRGSPKKEDGSDEGEEILVFLRDACKPEASANSVLEELIAEFG